MFRETPESVAAQIAKGGGAILILGETAIGSGRWVAVPGPGGQGSWMEVKRIGVLPEFQKQGLGAVILGALEEAGRAAGKQGAQLAIRADQLRLVNFYASLGYVLAGDVELTTVNPLSPPPIGMRKLFPARLTAPRLGEGSGRGLLARRTQGGINARWEAVA